MKGASFEREAINLLSSRGHLVFPSEVKEDIYKKIDFYVQSRIDGVTYSFDAKSMKALQRGGPLQDEWAWVEWRGVTGHPGWLVEGSQFIMFERREQVLLVRREQLLEFCKARTDLERRASRPTSAQYLGYSRVGREDLISLFAFKDLDIPYRTIPKIQD